jgi:hypothetical protein
MSPVLEKLQSLDIPFKGGPGWNGENEPPRFDDVTARVIRRAEQLRREWSAPRGARRLRSQPVDSIS